MRIKFAAFVILFLSVFSINCFANWAGKPEFRLQQLYHYDLRQDNHQLYNSRIQAAFTYLDKDKSPLFKVTPFFEASRNIDRNIWERKTLGMEVGKDIFSWLYLGTTFQQAQIKEDYHYYNVAEKESRVESNIVLLLSHSLISNDSFKLRGYIKNEYTYDYDEGEAVRNEVSAGFIVPIGKYAETAVNWRHIDRIHYYDSDTIEGSVTLVF